MQGAKERYQRYPEPIIQYRKMKYEQKKKYEKMNIKKILSQKRI